MKEKVDQFIANLKGQFVEVSDKNNVSILEIKSKSFGKINIILDKDDYDRVVEAGKWCASKDRNKFYFHHRINKKEKITLHRFLMGFPKGKYIDHINKNTLDNRKCNLRICSNGANLRNGLVRTNNKTGYTGVSINRNNNFSARIRVNYKIIHLGTFSKLKEAIKARKVAELKYFHI